MFRFDNFDNKVTFKNSNFLFFCNLFQFDNLGLLLLLSFVGFTAFAQNHESGNEVFPEDVLSISNTQIFSKYVLVVDKSERKLFVYDNQGGRVAKVEDFSADVGQKNGNKEKRDDKRTPEGIYFLKRKMESPEIPFDKYGKMAFTTDYPNFFDRRDGKTGSGIWLHSIPDSVPLTRGSKGCVVVRNEALSKLEQYIKLNETPLLIYDHVNYLSPEEHSRRKQEVADFLNAWRKSWESLDIEKYISNYADDFSSPGFHLITWKKHKENLKGKYQYVKVDLAEPYVFRHKDNIVIKTFQRYQSDKHTDFGIKTIYANKVGNMFKILREEWKPESVPASGTYTPWVIN